MIQYVVGFAFSRDKKDIVLIEKNKPDWQKGKFNGIGGKIDFEDSSPLDAMYREFKEETGVDFQRESVNGWKHFGTMQGEDWVCFCFRAFTNSIYQCTTVEDEKVAIMALDTALTVKPIIDNLKWLINLAKDEEVKFSNIEY